MTALLTIDWDFFFRNLMEADPDQRSGEDRQRLVLYDWGHREAPFFLQDIWTIRAAGFLRQGLPLPDTTGEEVAFWARCDIAPDARFYYSESHLMAGHPTLARQVTEVVNVDAHHDAGYRRPKSDDKRWATPVPPEVPEYLDCGNWAYRYLVRGASYRVVYPRWKGIGRESPPDWLTAALTVDDGHEIRSPSGEPFRLVHVARSGAWTPAWNDEKFRTFLRSRAPLTKWRRLGRTAGGFDLHLPVRPFSREEAQEQAEATARMIEESRRRATPGESALTPARP